jgi:hypothetical protein
VSENLRIVRASLIKLRIDRISRKHSDKIPSNLSRWQRVLLENCDGNIVPMVSTTIRICRCPTIPQAYEYPLIILENCLYDGRPSFDTRACDMTLLHRISKWRLLYSGQDKWQLHCPNRLYTITIQIDILNRPFESTTFEPANYTTATLRINDNFLIC